MSLGSKQGSTKSTQVTEPWKAQQPHLRNLFQRAENTFQAQGAPDMGLLNAANTQLQNTISGENLDPLSNPHFAGALNRTMGDVTAKINSQFSGDNFGSSAHQEWLGRGLTEATLPMLANQFNMERQNQMAATGMAPSLSVATADFPWRNLQNFQSAVSGNFGGTTTAEQPFFRNPLGEALGMGVGALALGKGFGLL